MEEAPAYVLSLSSDPAFLDRAGSVTLSWTIEGQVSAESPLTLEIAIPAGFNIMQRADREWFNPATRLFTMPVTSAQGSLMLRTNKVNDDVTFPARLLSGTEELAIYSLILPLHERFEVSKQGEGRVQVMNGKVRVTFPEGALDEDIVLNAGFPATDRLPKNGFSQNVFELKAHAKADEGREVKRFKTPLTIEVDYSGIELTEAQEDELYLYWYNEETGDWHALESYRDKETKTLRAISDHFTVFDIGVNDWRATRLPTVDAFQVSEFTGAASYSLPIQVPAGPGGFQPNLTLSYNSQVVDQATNKAQASWVGMGWSLDSGVITYNSTQYLHQMHVNGVSTNIIDQEQGNYRAEDENFWKIIYVADDPENTYWQVFDTQGTQYFFEADLTEPGKPTKPHTWYLTRIVNPFGQEIKYIYTNETKAVNGVAETSAVYLSRISYPNGRYRVRFVRGNRLDYPISWDTDAAYHMYERTRLTNIYVEQDENDDGVFETVVRRYAFIYYDDTDTANVLWPGIYHSAGGRTSTLKLVQEMSNGATLPATTFKYDGLHLTEASNGYGGIVQFEYDDPTGVLNNFDPFHPANTPASYQITVPACEGHGGEGWYLVSGEVECIHNGWRVLTNGVNRNAYFTNNLMGNRIVRPGGYYKIEYVIRNQSGGAAEFGLYTKTGGSTDYQPVPSNGGLVVLAKKAKTAEVYFKTPGSVELNNMTVSLMSSFYRVRKKTVSDSNGNSYNYTYSYTGPSQVITGGYPEFRGHQKVKVTNPDGTYTETTYLQGARDKGRVSNSCTYEPSGQKISCVENEYVIVNLPEAEPAGWLGHAWVYLQTQIHRIYNADGVLVGNTTTKYSYESTYGNMTEMKEYANDTGLGNAYRTTTTTYRPRNTATTYIVSSPARQMVTAGNGAVLSDILYFYDGAANNTTAPTQNLLTMARTLVLGDSAGMWYAQTNYGYDEWGNQITVKVNKNYGGPTSAPAASGAQITTTEYDPDYHTYPIAISNPLDQTVYMDYNYRLGVPTCESELFDHYYLGVVCFETPNHTTATYDNLGRITKLIRPGDNGTSPTLSMTYTQGTNSFLNTEIKLKINASQTYTINRVYDGLGREIAVTAGGILTETTYVDPYTTTQSMPGESDKVTTTTIYPNARQTNVTMPDGSYTATVSNGLDTTFRDARGYITTTTKDVWGRVTSVAPPTGPGVGYTYDAMNRLKTATRGGVTTSLEYDYAGHKLTMTDPDMGYWTYAYDALGNLKTQTDMRNCVLSLGYDILNRLKTKISSGNCDAPVSTSYIYDAGTNGLGRRTSMTSGSIANSWTYDERGRVETETVMGYKTEYTYNSADLLTSMKYPDNEVVTYDYNDRMLLEKVLSNNSTPSNLTDDIAFATMNLAGDYDAAGRLTRRLLGNGVTQNYTYNPWTVQGGRLQNITTGALQDLNYTYDAAGNVSQITNNIASETNTYGYDPLDRLTSWTLTGGTSETYAYDPSSGNLQTKAGITLTYEAAPPVNCNNNGVYSFPIPHAVSSAGGNTYQYDCNGNQTSRVIGGQTYSLTYNAENQLVTVTGPNGFTATFVYDGDGRRVKAVENGVTTLFIGAHYEVKGSEITKYYFAGMQRIAMRKYTIPQNSTLTYLLGDHLGSTSLAVDSVTGETVETRYKPWGEVRYTTANKTLPTRYTFTGQFSYVSDEATDLGSAGFGLLFYNARWVDPVLGRFAQADSIVPDGVQGLDRYAYGLNNPVRYNDPSGHWPIPDPFAYDTLSIGFRGLLKEIIGIDADIVVNINLKAIKEFDTKNIDASINVDATISAGISSEAAVGVVIYGNEGTVLDQSDFQLIGHNREVPITVGGCLEEICASALYTIDGGDPDGLSGEGFFIGVGSPAGIDLSADIIGGSDYIAYGDIGGEKDHWQVPFLNERFLKKIPLLGKLFAE